MDFEDSLADLNKNISFDNEDDEIGFGLDEHKLKQLKAQFDAVIFAID
jgi:hypothetical protein